MTATLTEILDGPLHTPLALFHKALRSGRLVELDLLCRQVAA